MSWTKTETGYQRPLAHTESLYNFFASNSEGHEIHVTTSIKIDTTYPEDELRARLKNAWIGIHHHYPHVASLIEEFTFVYTPLESQEDIDAWLEETFVVDEIAMHPEEVKQIVSRRPRLYYFPRVKRIVLSCGHAVIDGIGTAIFFNKLLELVEENEAYNILGLDASRLTPPLHHAVGGVNFSPEDIESADKVVEDYGNAYPSVGPKMKEASGPTVGHSDPVVLTKEETTALVLLAKVHGVTVTSAVHAAMLELLYEDHVLGLERSDEGDNPVKNYSSFTFFNMRHLINDPVVAKDPFSPYHSCLPIHYSLDGTSEDRLRRAEKYFNDNKLAYKHNVQTDSVGFADPKVAQFAIVPRIVKPHLTPVVNANASAISSFGVIDNYLKYDHPDLHVTDYTINVYQHSSRVVLMFWTFKNRLHLTWLYNEAYYTSEYVKDLQIRFRAKVFDILK